MTEESYYKRRRNKKRNKTSTEVENKPELEGKWSNMIMM